MSLLYKKVALNEAAVDEISANVQAYLEQLHTDSSSVHRIRLTLEEMLLNLLGRADRPEQVSIGLGKQFGRRLLRLRYDGPAFDPTKSSDSPWSDDIMRSLGLSPSWNYRGKVNTVSLVLSERPKRSMVFYILLAVFAAAALGLAGGLFPDALRQGLIDAVLTPVEKGFLGLLKTFAGLMIALTVCNGILGMGDSASFGRKGKSALTRFIVYSFAVSAVTVPLVLPFVKTNLSSVSGGQTSSLEQLSRLFFDILPSDLITPFQSGNALPIIVIAVIVGIGLIGIGERGSRLRGLVNESTTLFQRIVSMICSLVPIYIFAMLLKQLWSGQEIPFASFLKTLILSIGLTLLLVIVVWLISAVRLQCSPLTLMKKILPPSLIALTTASSMAALPLVMDVSEKKLGIRKSTVSFVMPLGLVIYMPTSIINLAVLALTFAEIYRVEISWSFLLLAVVLVPLCAIALPPIPGAALIVFSILFGSLGLPSEAIAMAIALDIVFDFFDTGCNIILLMLRGACEAKKQGDLDQTVLVSR